MQGFGYAIKYLYEKFILRDVLSFVTPGALVVLAASLLFLSGSLPQQLETLLRYSRETHWLLYILLFGAFYLVGFAVQCLGEITGLIQFTPYAEKSWHKRRSMFCCSWDKNYDKPQESNIWWWKEHEELKKFWEATREETKYNENAQQGRERLVVLKQMCANGFLAIIIAAILLAISYIPLLWVKLVLLIILVVLPLVASLFWGHRVHVLRQYTREKLIIPSRQPRQK